MSLVFTKEALKKIRTQGSIIPSSSALGRRMLRPLTIRPDTVIVELGAGTGIFTKEIMGRLPAGAKLIAFENNKALAEKLRVDFHDDLASGGLILVEDDAAALGDHLRRLNIPQAHYIVSGLPIGNFSRTERQKIFDAIYAGMRDDGIYVQFQYLLASWLHARKVFRAKIIGFELRNIPPAFVYSCRKK
ncbi:MAG: rRNA adenine N-6-methyltransferase family protein [Candidatus Taylorbacteria bacterium]